jgi:AAA+ ATPase superfamily predicted ATPase
MAFTLRPAVGKNFLDRKEIIKDMVETLSNRNIDMGFALMGPRRVGKTSILKEVARILSEKKEVVPIYISIWELAENNIREFSQEFTAAIFDAFKPRFAIRHRLKEILKVPANKIYNLLKTLDIHIKIMDEIEIELEKKEKKVYTGVLIENLFKLVETLSYEFKVRSILMIDEFPSIIDLKNGEKIGEGIIRKIRTINEGLEKTILCVSGSIRKTMESAILSPSSPFYRQLIVKKIEPLDESSVRKLLQNNLNKTISEDAFIRAYNLTHGIPFYVQFIGRELEKETKVYIDRISIDKAFHEMLYEEGDIIFSQEFYSLNDKEKAILKTMSLYNLKKLSEIAHKLNEGSNIIGKYMEYLIYKGVINKQTKGNYQIMDSVFEEWIKGRFQ